MVKIHLGSRLGNQMFQYAFAVAAAKRLGTPYCIDNLLELEMFRLGGFAFNYKNALKRRHFDRRMAERQAKRGKSKPEIIRLKDHWLPPKEHLSKLRDNVAYRGYFQSEQFFENAAPQVRRHFRFRKSLLIPPLSSYGRLFSEHRVIAIHVRAGDYKNWGEARIGGPDMTLPRRYYQRCLGQIERGTDDVVLVVSDDLEYARELFPGHDDFLYVQNSVAVDFQLLKNADVLVIANSTFSWWSAWLGERAGRQVYAPQYWLGFKIGQEWPVGILPTRWRQVTVT